MFFANYHRPPSALFRSKCSLLLFPQDVDRRIVRDEYIADLAWLLRKCVTLLTVTPPESLVTGTFTKVHSITISSI